MQSRHRFIGVGTVLILLLVFGVSQLQAQGEITLESLASRVTTLTRRVTSLSTGKVDRREFQRLQQKVATVEAKLETLQPRSTNTPTRPRPTATQTRPRPTATYTRVRPTSTPVPVVPFITITRPMNLRRGPGTNYSIVRVAEEGERFDITGRNSNGSWWRIDVEGENAWVYASYVTATNADRIRSVPTPIPPRPTATAVPQSSSLESEELDTFEYALALAILDRSEPSQGRKWESYSLAEQGTFVSLTQGLLESTAEYCRMPVSDAAQMVNIYGNLLDEVGYTARNDVKVRNVLMLVLVQSKESARTPSGCDLWLTRATRRLIESD